jgi:Secretion system C-terminal sorting domain
MKRLIFLSGFIFLSAFTNAQNLPACDTLIINCCAVDSVGPNTVTLYASNYSSVLFDYPGFVLFDSNMDTIAKEVVNYFGIGQFPQLHTLEVVAPLNLPFTGFLNLYTLFYDSFACSFPITIEATGVNNIEQPGIHIFPNPAEDVIMVQLADYKVEQNLLVSILDMFGKEVYTTIYTQSPFRISLKGLTPGIYLLRITDATIGFVASIVVVRK